MCIHMICWSRFLSFQFDFLCVFFSSSFAFIGCCACACVWIFYGVFFSSLNVCLVCFFQLHSSGAVCCCCQCCQERCWLVVSSCGRSNYNLSKLDPLNRIYILHFVEHHLTHIATAAIVQFSKYDSVVFFVVVEYKRAEKETDVFEAI